MKTAGIAAVFVSLALAACAQQSGQSPSRGGATLKDPIPERITRGEIAVKLEAVADGMVSPLGLVAPDDNSGRLFIFDQDGRIWVLQNGRRETTALLDVRDRLVPLVAYEERGLLGLAVHPGFARTPLIYTHTSEPYLGTADFQTGLGAKNNHQSVIAEWRVVGNRVDPASRREILRIDQPQANHNGGAMHFGPDRMLYFGMGDGGAANDDGKGHVPGGNGQSTSVILGKILRIDVHGTNSINGRYGIPSDNPLQDANAIREIYAYGFRNPYAFSFDRQTGALYAGDVGQNKIEEIDLVTKGGNYGWSLKEGSFWFDGAGGVSTTPAGEPSGRPLDPIAEYDHDEGASVIGGFVYRGKALPELQGRYLFGDWGAFHKPNGRLFYLDANNAIRELRIVSEDDGVGLWIKGFGEDADGELYVLGSRMLGPSGDTGRVLKLVAAKGR